MKDRPYTLRLVRVAGIDVFVHVSWLGIAALISLGLFGWLTTEHPGLADSTAVALALLGAALFFGSVLVHEFAHALMARRRHIGVDGITLYLFGGATEADASSRSAADEFVIAVVGPATSLVIAATLGLGSVLAGGQEEPLADLLGYLAAINLALAVFNMAPGLPLDGGRVFRSIVWAVSDDFDKATRWATAGGIVVGYALIGAGFIFFGQGALGGLWLVAIGWMISQSARANELQERMRATFGALTASDVMTSPVVSIPASTLVADAVADYVVNYDHTTFPVVDGDAFVGLFTVAAARGVPSEAMRSTTVGELAANHPPALMAEPRTPMIDVLAALSGRTEHKARAVVIDGGAVVGVISPADVLRRQSLIDLIGKTKEETDRDPTRPDRDHRPRVR